MRQQLIDLSKEWPALFNNKPNKVDEIYKEIKNILSNITKKSNHQDYIKIKEIVPNISNQIIPLKIKLKINNKDQLIEKIKSAIYEKN